MLYIHTNQTLQDFLYSIYLVLETIATQNATMFLGVGHSLDFTICKNSILTENQDFFKNINKLV